MNEVIARQATMGQELESSIREIGIPPRPAILIRVSEEARSDDPNFNRLADIIGRDVGLSAGMIKTANSPFYGYRQKCRSVREALIMLGLQSTVNTVAGLVMRRIFPPQYQLERFWDASERTAEVSGWLVQQLGIRFGIRAEDAYTFGLFRDCGIPIMMRRFSGYQGILARANENDTHAFTDVEQAEVPTNHALVGSLMTQSWWLPEITTVAVRYHHDLAALSAPVVEVGGASLRLIVLAQLAEKIVQDMTGLNRTREWEKLGSACLNNLELNEDDYLRLSDDAKVFIATLPPL